MSRARSEDRSQDRPVTACFHVHAAAEPGVMPRVLALFAKRGLVPTAWHSAVSGAAADGLDIDIQMAGLGAAEAAYIARCLRALADVRTVLISEKGYAKTA